MDFLGIDYYDHRFIDSDYYGHGFLDHGNLEIYDILEIQNLDLISPNGSRVV